MGSRPPRRDVEAKVGRHLLRKRLRAEAHEERPEPDADHLRPHARTRGWPGARQGRNPRQTHMASLGA